MPSEFADAPGEPEDENPALKRFKKWRASLLSTEPQGVGGVG
jgi:hypothetical protein